MKKLFLSILSLGLILSMGTSALADYTEMEIICANLDSEGRESVAFVYEDKTSGEQDPEVVGFGDQKRFRDEAPAWFLTETVYEYTLKVHKMGQTDPTCSYWFQMANRWDFSDWKFGPKVRYGDSKSLIETKACTMEFSCTDDGCQAYVRYVAE